jgi:HEAT repeat protein
VLAAASSHALAQGTVDPVVTLIQSLDGDACPGSADRLAAVRTLARIAQGNPVVVGKLGQLVGDDDLRVRNAAAQALLQLGPAASAAVPNLIRVLEEGPAPDRAARVLESMGPFATAAVPALFGLLEHDDAAVRQRAAVAIRAIRDAHRRSPVP